MSVGSRSVQSFSPCRPAGLSCWGNWAPPSRLTRGSARVHAGTEEERRSLRKEVVSALRGALPNGRRAGRYAPPAAAWSPASYMAGVKRTQEYFAAGDVSQLVRASRFSGQHELDPFQA